MAAALLCLFSQLAALAHADLAPHGICADHGELTDLIPSDVVPRGQAVDRDQGHGIGVHLPEAVSFRADDDHCVVAQLLRQTGPARSALLLPVAPAAVPALAAVADRATTSSSPLDVAPKQSPPV